MIAYLCKSLRIISLVWPTRLIFLAMGEVLSFGFNLAVSFPSDNRGNNARILLLPSRIKRWSFISYCLSLSLYIMSSSLKHYSVLLNLILQMHGGQRSMCGVIVVDAGRSRSTCLGRDAYIHDHTQIFSLLCTFLSIARQ